MLLLLLYSLHCLIHIYDLEIYKRAFLLRVIMLLMKFESFEHQFQSTGISKKIRIINSNSGVSRIFVVSNFGDASVEGISRSASLRFLNISS